ncbi:metallophosphoesterase 1 isoform X3 [Zonotrichia albicollis]|uniref:metallophosphoesterase 1 isoform X3 n=1 Tax=Zonotrichia albicollis TaxID=44394 RepID=UPI003D80B2B6
MPACSGGLSRPLSGPSRPPRPLSRSVPPIPGPVPPIPGPSLPILGLIRPIPAYPSGLSRPILWLIPAYPGGLSRGPTRFIPPAVPALAMALPVVHRCLQLTDENEQLVKKVKKLHIKNKELERNLDQIQEQLYLQQLMHVCGTSRELLQMYNELQKRYVKETKTNKEQSEAIKNLTIKINELEHNLQEQRQRIEQLECKKVSWKTSAVSRKRSQTPEGGVTSHKDISAEKEACCGRYLGNGTVYFDDVPSSMPSRENAFYFSRNSHSRLFLLLQPAVFKMFFSFLKTGCIKIAFYNLGFLLAFVIKCLLFSLFLKWICYCNQRWECWLYLVLVFILVRCICADLLVIVFAAPALVFRHWVTE